MENKVSIWVKMLKGLELNTFYTRTLHIYMM